MTGGADAFAEEPAHTGQSLLVLGALELLGDGQAGIAKSEVELVNALLRGDRDVLLLLGSVEHDLLLPPVEIPPGHIGADTEFAGDLGLDVEAERLPWKDRAVVDALGLVADENGVVDLTDRAGSLAVRTGTEGVEGERLRTRWVEAHPADRTDDRLAGGDGQRRLLPVPVRA